MSNAMLKALLVVVVGLAAVGSAADAGFPSNNDNPPSNQICQPGYLYDGPSGTCIAVDVIIAQVPLNACASVVPF